MTLHLNLNHQPKPKPQPKPEERDSEGEEEERDLDAALSEGSASISKGETKRLAMAVLDTVLTSYFRVLKLEPPASELLPPVLEGLRFRV